DTRPDTASPFAAHSAAGSGRSCPRCSSSIRSWSTRTRCGGPTPSCSRSSTSTPTRTWRVSSGCCSCGRRERAPMSAGVDASGFDRRQGVFHCGGVPVPEVEARVRARWGGIDAFYLYDAEAIAERTRRFLAAFRALSPHVAFAIKANPLPWLLSHLARLGLGADV